ncbi:MULTISPECIES: Bug family tripartite tricarboxylate transporter substrate binding protein [Ramlibacter]|uniref:Tripartite tricarboxylate transporter substrate binding protein n=1 Tax=Ramlibacter pinisoli TaxID=2682844 RepID=A0A6N8J0Q1_9BURK|nr:MULTISPECIES: tripartite tricarboxylate transporter substrate binding protein [Ramlibacter]MBA2962666.1 tripartite tricarboxylate transporter substrate binding protein [Ramlibacter sp. CGMCC 1.13660]MVQ32608.1 tripartite tricarboxylate transporter substrate binding protein [Ramlibacter pinisoli]
MTTEHIHRRRVLRLVGAAGLAAMAPLAWSQGTFPQKPMRIVVPFAPGTGSDVIARTVGQKITEETGQSVVIENREGGGGIVGTMNALQAQPDGYTLLMVANPFTIVAGTNLKPPYDPLRDFSPVAKVAIVPIVLTIANNLNINSVKELVAYAKANPGKLSYASSGPGTPSQLEMELFKQAAGVDIVEVPYKSTAQAMTDVIGGQIAMYPSAMPLCLQHVKAGRVRALGLFDAQRSPALPDVPHFAEALGVPGYVATPLWYGFVTRAGTPRETVSRLRDLVTRSMASKDVSEKLVPLGAHPITPSSEEFTQQMAAEVEKSARLAKTLGIVK